MAAAALGEMLANFVASLCRLAKRICSLCCRTNQVAPIGSQRLMNQMSLKCWADFRPFWSSLPCAAVAMEREMKVWFFFSLFFIFVMNVSSLLEAVYGRPEGARAVASDLLERHPLCTAVLAFWCADTERERFFSVSFPAFCESRALSLSPPLTSRSPFKPRNDAFRRQIAQRGCWVAFAA